MSRWRQTDYPDPSGRGATVIYSARREKFQPPHPWEVSCYWDAPGGRWLGLVSPGFVNGLPVLVPLAAPEIEAQALPAVGGEVEIWDAPLIPLVDFRQVGSVDQDPIPPFFKALGVRLPSDGFVISESQVTQDTTPDPESAPPARALFALDLSVAVARASYQAGIEIVDGSGTSGSFVDLGVTFDTGRLDQVGSRARLRQSPKFEPVREPTLFDRLLGGYLDDGEDRERIATVYFLAPENVLNGPVGPAWEPFVGYSDYGCWNLCHAAANVPPAADKTNIRLFTGLAGGIGDDIVNRQLAFLNDQTNAVAAAISATNNNGAFWSI